MDQVISNQSLESLILEKVGQITHCKDTTRAYIVCTLKSYAKESINLSNKSVGLDYLNACHGSDFKSFQNIADWIFFIQSTYPQYFEENSKRYYLSIGQNSYYKCYCILNKKWDLFEELADNFVFYADTIYLHK